MGLRAFARRRFDLHQREGSGTGHIPKIAAGQATMAFCATPAHRKNPIVRRVYDQAGVGRSFRRPGRVAFVANHTAPSSHAATEREKGFAFAFGNGLYIGVARDAAARGGFRGVNRAGQRGRVRIGPGRGGIE